MNPFAKQPLKKAMIWAPGISVLLTLCFLVSGLRGQVIKMAAGAFGQKKPATQKGRTFFPVCDVISIPVFTSSPTFIVNPDGREIDAGDSFLFQVDVTSAGGGSKGGGLNVYLQTSCDDGRTWNDVAVAQARSFITGTFVAFVSTVADAPTTIAAVQDGTMLGGTDVQGPVGKRFRIRCANSAVGVPGGVWTFQAFIHTQNQVSAIAKRRSFEPVQNYVPAVARKAYRGPVRRR